jgi:hypothetical protein
LFVACFLLVNSPASYFKPNLFPYKYPNILNPSHSSYLPAYEDGTDIVFGNVTFRHWGITQEKACNIQNMAKVWNQGYCLFIPSPLKNAEHYKMAPINSS